MEKITIDGVVKEYPEGLKYEEIAREYQEKYDNMIALVLENGKIRELIGIRQDFSVIRAVCRTGKQALPEYSLPGSLLPWQRILPFSDELLL